VVKVTAADEQALEALRREEEQARMEAEANMEARKSRTFAEVKEGELAAVTRNGDVYRLNPYKLDFAGIEGTLTGISSTGGTRANAKRAATYHALRRRVTSRALRLHWNRCPPCPPLDLPPRRSGYILLSHLLHVDRLALVGEGGVAGDDEQPRQPRDRRRDLLHHAVDEVFLPGIAGHVLKR
jgi:hypothetical protein